VRVYGLRKRSRAKYSYDGVSWVTDGTSILSGDVLVPAGPADEALQPAAGTQTRRALEEPGPLVRRLRAHALDGELAYPRQSEPVERLRSSDDSILRIERLQPAFSEPLLVLGGEAVGQRLEQEHRDPGLAVALEDLVDCLGRGRLRYAEPDGAYRPTRRSTRAEETRGAIMAAVRDLLAEGTFHESTVDQVADRAGIARATLYQHFRSRFDLVDAICDTFAVSPALTAIRQAIELPDPDEALAEVISNSVRFWSSEDAVLGQLYGVVAIDPAARDLVDRQRADRRGAVQALVRRLRKEGRLRAGRSERDAVADLMVLTSYETFRELREAGLAERELVAHLQESSRVALLR
jgi:AcrR family transcriptional regulator